MTNQTFTAVVAAIVLYALLFYTKQVLAILICCAAVYLALAVVDVLTRRFRT